MLDYANKYRLTVNPGFCRYQLNTMQMVAAKGHAQFNIRYISEEHIALVWVKQVSFGMPLCSGMPFCPLPHIHG